MSAASAAHRLPIRGEGRRPSRVRPYSLTGGRTRFGHVLLVETFVAALEAGPAAPACDMSVIACHMALFVGRAGRVLAPELRDELRDSVERKDATVRSGR